MTTAPFGNNTKAAILIVAVALCAFGPGGAWGQTDPCGGEQPDAPEIRSCPPGIPLTDEFHATPLIDGNTGLKYPPGATGNQETITLYGEYGNQPDSSNPALHDHYLHGLTEVASIYPRNLNGQRDDQNGAIVVLTAGFSNTDIEMCGGQHRYLARRWTSRGRPTLRHHLP